MDGVNIETKARFAPAKVNLALHVVGRRDDGYHLLESIVVFDKAAGDKVGVALRPAHKTGEEPVDRLTIEGPFAAEVPAGPQNILQQAAALARNELAGFGLALPPLDIQLTKNLPVAAGIGGGSADAAALIKLIGEELPQEAHMELSDAAIRLGADVPMCLAGRPAFITGIGEDIRPLAAMPELAMLLVNPGIAVETAAVFRMLARRDNPPMPALPSAGFTGTTDLVTFLGETRNDLALAAGSLVPEIEIARACLTEAGALFARMSGSGATVFGLYADEAAADAAARQIATKHPGWWLSRSPSDGSEESRP